jgi:nitrate reductase delta subunit
MAICETSRLDEKALAGNAAGRTQIPMPDDLEALDAAWEEEEVTFGPGAADATGACSVEGLSTRLRAAMRPAEGVAPPLTHGRSTGRHATAPSNPGVRS